MTFRSMLAAGLAVALGSGTALANVEEARSGSDEFQDQPGQGGSATGTGQAGSGTFTVIRTDPSSNTVTFQVPLAPGANIMGFSGRMGLDQLKPGDQVRASFDPTSGNVVRMQVIGSAAGPHTGCPCPECPMMKQGGMGPGGQKGSGTQGGSGAGNP